MNREAGFAALSKEYQAMYGKDNMDREHPERTRGLGGPAQAARPVPNYLLPNVFPNGWIFDSGDGTAPMIIYDNYAANILMAENPQYRVRPFIFLKTEI